jgi:hypothetical protein
MEALFFTATREMATRVRSGEDLEDEPAAEPLRVDSPGAVVALSVVLCGNGRGSIEQLRDATCQSFPVWSLSASFANALSSIRDEDIDSIAESWLEKAGGAEIEADLYELTTCLTDLRRASASAQDGGEQLFVLFEERALP